MNDGRAVLPVGTTVEFDSGEVYRITGEPIGSGGGSILYPARKQYLYGGILVTENILCALKECYPSSLYHAYTRKENGEIAPAGTDLEDMHYLNMAQLLLVEEKNVSQNIYRTASRVLPIRGSSRSVALTLPGQQTAVVSNTVTVMDSLTEKGRSLTAWMKERGRFTPAEALRVIQQLLFSLREVHQAGYLHLDIQDGNVFLRGTLEDMDELVTLIDFGSAREMIHGKTEPIRDKMIFTTQGFSAPEMLLYNDGNLQLGPGADIYSTGCLLLYLLTGQRANISVLMANRSGMILKPNQLRRIRCPEYLVESLQHILAKALATKPENRYLSAEDMLRDVTALAEALQPKATSLNTVQYDAFVCYKHGPVDSAAALTLQRALENYRAPRGVAPKARPFRRVFVDEGELSSCGDFGQQIREALKNSGWLIVLCSEETPLSPWVRQEIDIFLKYHDRSRILAVLTGGTPETSFPPQLRAGADGTGEVFAAHALSRTPQEAAKQLRGDALLKIAAPMLGRKYDDLKQRQKIYRRRRRAAAAAAVLLAAGCFAAYAANRAKVISEQADRIQEEHRTALLQESRVLIEQAEKKLKENDPHGAMRLVLPILTGEEQDRAAATKAEYILGKALGIYETPNTALFSAMPVGLADTDCREFFLDSDGAYLFAWDGKDENVQVWDAQTLQLTVEITPADPVAYTDGDLLLPENHALILRTGSAVVCGDYLSGEQIWEFPADNARAVCLSPDRQQVIVLRSDYRSQAVSADILSAETGALLRQIPFELRENHEISSVNHLRISQDGTRIVFTAWGEEPEEDDAYGHVLYLLNLETGACSLLIETGTAINAVEIFGDRVAVMRWKGSSSGTRASVCSMWFELYDCASRKQLWHQERDFYPRTGGCDKIKRIPGYVTERGQDSILFAFADQCLLADWETGEILHRYEMQAPIAQVFCGTAGFDVIGSDGSASFANYDTDEFLTVQLMSGTMTAVRRSGNNFYAQCDSETGQDYRIRKFAWGKYDDAYVPLYTAESKTWYLGETYKDENRNSGIRLEQPGRIRYVNLFTGEVRDYPIPEEYGFAGGYSSDGEKVYWRGGSWYDSKASAPYYMLDLQSGEIRELTKPEGFDERLYITDMLFSDGKILFAAEAYEENQKTAGLYCWDLNTDVFSRLCSSTLDASGSLMPNTFSKADGQLYFAVRNDELLPAAFVWFDLSTQETKTIELDFPVEKTEDWDVCCHWSTSGDLLAFSYGNRAYLTDAAGKLLHSFLSEETVASIVFSPDEEYLYVFERYGTVLKYRVSDGLCTDRLSLRDYCVPDGHVRGSVSLGNQELQWMFPDESELLVYNHANGGFLMDVSGDRLLMKAVLPKCSGYDREMKEFLVTDVNYLSGQISSLGVIPRYSPEALVQKAQEILEP